MFMWKMLALVGAMFDWGADNKPGFCGDLDCPAYKVINTTKVYELRCYPETLWVSTKSSQDAGWKSQKESFMRLFKYISGANSKEAKIPMTAPVTMSMNMDQKTKSGFTTMSFYVSEADPPTPTDPKVQITKSPASCYYVQSYGGYSTKMSVRKHAGILMKALKKHGEAFSDKQLWSAGYDSPMKFWKRHNEVWLQKVEA